MSRANSFAAAAYESRERAEQALAELEKLADEKKLHLRDAAIAERRPDGRVELNQTKELSVGQGAIAGGVAGILIGLALGGPIGGALAGMAIGGGAGAFDMGIKNKRLKELAGELEPGQAVLGVLLREVDWATVRPRLAPFGGDLVVAELTQDEAERLEQSVVDGQSGSPSPSGQASADSPSAGDSGCGG